MMTIADTDAWSALESSAENLSGTHIRSLFNADPDRARAFRIKAGDLILDYSRHHLDDASLGYLHALAEAADVQGFFRRMVAGEKVNATEDRAALHMACRGTTVGDETAEASVAECDARLRSFVEAVHEGRVTASNGEPFETVVAIGIGGSELGPVLALDALRSTKAPLLEVRVCGNIDGEAFRRAVADLDPARTLVIVISKSFKTVETSLNAASARSWLEAELDASTEGHFVGVTANPEAARVFGIPADRVFPLWEWVGGRYSLWSAVGLPVALGYGWSAFAELRAGAKLMDTHVMSAAISENAPLTMALLTVWNANFLGSRTEGRIPYDTRLAALPAYLQQLEMESNGKATGLTGSPSPARQPAVVGGVGTNAQHALFQQLHQGPDPIPIDILIPCAGPDGAHDELRANAIAQADALAFGSDQQAEPHRQFLGNRPSTLVLYPDLTPSVLGQLIALYEHKTIAAAAVWGINPFDQWGVELGKALSKDVLNMMQGKTPVAPHLAPLLEDVATMRKDSK